MVTLRLFRLFPFNIVACAIVGQAGRQMTRPLRSLIHSNPFVGETCVSLRESVNWLLLFLATGLACSCSVHSMSWQSFGRQNGKCFGWFFNLYPLNRNSRLTATAALMLVALCLALLLLLVLFSCALGSPVALDKLFQSLAHHPRHAAVQIISDALGAIPQFVFHSQSANRCVHVAIL
jgi:hypothetical protein